VAISTIHSSPITNHVFVASPLPLLFPLLTLLNFCYLPHFMRRPEDEAREKIEFAESPKLENAIRANLAGLVYGP
jgi:hypothetical protein